MIQHNEEQTRFEFTFDGHLAELNYHVLDDKVLEYHRTFVPPEGRGQGIAGKLAEAALSYAQEKGLRVKPTCSYVQKYIENHEEYQSLL